MAARHLDEASRQLLLLVAVASVLCFITFGVRSAFGIFTGPFSAALGWSREIFALSIAVQNLVWGLIQPLAGGLVDRFGARRVIAAGGMLLCAGIALTPGVDQPFGLHLTAGVLVGLGMGGASYATVIGVLGRAVPARSRSWALGVATAAGSLGQFLIVPLGQLFVALYSWQSALLVMAALAALVPMLAMGFGGRGGEAADQGRDFGFAATISGALAHPGYLMLLAGFFVCGFQIAFITVHLPPYLTDRGLDAGHAAWMVGVIGLANVLGAYGAGVLGGRFSKPRLLAVIYFGRAAAIVLFVAAPLSAASSAAFAAAMGLLWLSTVPLTSGLVAVMFGTRYLTTLFGVVFLAHQLGSFLGAWLGGVVFDRTASYDGVWWISAMLGVAAGVINLAIAEQAAPSARRLPT